MPFGAGALGHWKRVIVPLEQGHGVTRTGT